MLEIEHQRARSREFEFGSDWPVVGGQRGNPVWEWQSAGGLWLGEAIAGSAGVQLTEQGSARPDTALH
jgi:hypothetical protein